MIRTVFAAPALKVLDTENSISAPFMLAMAPPPCSAQHPFARFPVNAHCDKVVITPALYSAPPEPGEKELADWGTFPARLLSKVQSTMESSPSFAIAPPCKHALLFLKSTRKSDAKPLL
jgi:hypothetical protein